ncbi:MAG: ABC transporter permease, partial [Desulfuromusa sp.]|nr:ABC transporter permease [Desulfuromusa sp.]
MDFNPKRRFYPWLPFFTLLRKEILRFWRVSTQTLLAPIVTAGLYLLVFGATLGDRLSIVEGFSYAQFVIPGLIMMGVINNSFANTSSSLFMSRYLGGIVDLLVTPVSPPQFIMAYTLAAMLRGLLVGSVVWIISTMFATLPWESPFLGILMAMLASFMFA